MIPRLSVFLVRYRSARTEFTASEPITTVRSECVFFDQYSSSVVIFVMHPATVFASVAKVCAAILYAVCELDGYITVTFINYSSLRLNIKSAVCL